MLFNKIDFKYVIILLIILLGIIMFLKTRESFTWLCDSSSDLASYGFDADKPIKINPKLFTATHRGIHMPEISNIYSVPTNIVQSKLT